MAYLADALECYCFCAHSGGLKMPKPDPVVSLVVNGRILKAYCPLCGQDLGLEKSAALEEQQVMVQAAFDRHLIRYHHEMS